MHKLLNCYHVPMLYYDIISNESSGVCNAKETWVSSFYRAGKRDTLARHSVVYMHDRGKCHGIFFVGNRVEHLWLDTTKSGYLVSSRHRKTRLSLRSAIARIFCAKRKRDNRISSCQVTFSNSKKSFYRQSLGSYRKKTRFSSTFSPLK